MGYVDANGKVRPPFIWDEARRLTLRAKFDALYFILYGVFDPANAASSRDDIRYISAPPSPSSPRKKRRNGEAIAARIYAGHGSTR